MRGMCGGSVHYQRQSACISMSAIKLRCRQQIRTRRNAAKLKSATGTVHGCRGAIDKGCGIAFIVGEHHLHLATGKVLHWAEEAPTYGDCRNSLQMEVGIAMFATLRQGNF